MKTRLLRIVSACILVCLGVVAFTSCKKKPTSVTPPTSETPTSETPTSVTPPTSNVEHKAASEWSKDGTSHWHACVVDGCTEKFNEATHSGGTADCQHKAVCSVCGQEYGNLGDHVPSATWSYDDAQHYHVCTVEGCTEKLDTTAHSYTWAPDPTNPDQHIGTCVCGKIVTAAHDYGEGVETTPAEIGVDGERTFTCKCGDIRTEKIDMIVLDVAGRTYKILDKSTDIVFLWENEEEKTIYEVHVQSEDSYRNYMYNFGTKIAFDNQDQVILSLAGDSVAISYFEIGDNRKISFYEDPLFVNELTSTHHDRYGYEYRFSKGRDKLTVTLKLSDTLESKVAITLFAGEPQHDYLGYGYETDDTSLSFNWIPEELEALKETLHLEQPELEAYFAQQVESKTVYFVSYNQVKFGNEEYYYRMDYNGLDIILYEDLTHYTNYETFVHASARFNAQRDEIVAVMKPYPGNESTLSITLDVIEKTPVEIPQPETTEFVYAGGEVVFIEENEFYEVQDGSAYAPGSYLATLTLKDKARYVWEDGTNEDKYISWMVDLGESNIQLYPGYSSNPTKIYDGAPAVAPGSETYHYEGDGMVSVEWYKGDVLLPDAPTDAGEYVIRYTVAPTMYYYGSYAEKAYTITQKTLIVRVFKAYDGDDLIKGDVVCLSSSNVIEADQAYVTLTIAEGAKYPSAAVQTNTNLDVNVIVISGDRGGNYRVSRVMGTITEA